MLKHFGKFNCFKFIHIRIYLCDDVEKAPDILISSIFELVLNLI